MDDRRMVESAAEYLRTRHPTLARNREEEAVDVVLAALREEGYDLYRPEECKSGTITPGQGFVGFVVDGTEMPPVGERYRLVPVSEGTEPQ